MRFFWLVVAGTLNGAAHGAIIDSFDVGPQSITANFGNSNVGSALSGLDTTKVLDGQRLLTIQGEISVGSIVATVDTSAGGSLTYESNNPVFTNSFDGRLLVTHIAGDRFNTFDLSSFASQFYIVDFESAFFGGNGPFDATVRVSSPTGSDSTTLTIMESSNPFRAAISMSDLGGADLSQAFNLTLDIGNIPSTSAFEINNISFATAVPEPTGCMFVACASIAAIGFRRRFAPGWHTRLARRRI